jgi:hypothetical protein
MDYIKILDPNKGKKDKNKGQIKINSITINLNPDMLITTLNVNSTKMQIKRLRLSQWIKSRKIVQRN